MKLSPTQYKFLGIYFGHSWAVTEKDGTYMPYMRQMRTVQVLVANKCIEWQNTGINGFTYNGYTITQLGRAAYKEHLARKK